MNLFAFFRFRGPKEERREAFADGLAVSREEYTVELLAATVEAQKQGLDAVMAGLRHADKYEPKTPVEAKFIALYQEGMLRLTAAVVTGQTSSEDFSFSGSLDCSPPS